MQNTAKLSHNGGHETLTLPDEFRFGCDEVNIRKDPATGDVILSRKEHELDEFFALLDELTPEERNEFKVPRDMTPVRIPNF